MAETQGMILQKVVDKFNEISGKNWNDFSCETEVSASATANLEDEFKLFRSVMSLMKLKWDQDTKAAISFNLSFLLLKSNGLIKFLSAILDLDESSQVETTLDQRFIAVSNVICFMPHMCVPYKAYLEILAPQIYSLFESTSDRINQHQLAYCRRIGTQIISGLLTRKKKMAHQIILEPLLICINGNTSSPSLNIEKCVNVLYGLAINNFDLVHILSTFSDLFYLRCSLETSISNYKSKLDCILGETLKKVDHSHHVLDGTLFNYSPHLIYKYKIKTDDISGQVHFTCEPKSKNPDLDPKQIDTITVITLQLAQGHLTKESQVDFLLLLLERLPFVKVMNPSQGLLFCSILSSLQEALQHLFVEMPSRFLTFVTTILNQSVSDVLTATLVTENLKDQEEEEEGSLLSAIHNDSTAISVEILKHMVSEQVKLSRDDIISLKKCADSLENLILALEKEEEKTGKYDLRGLFQLRDDILSLDPDNGAVRDVENRETFEQAMKDLNDPIMPTRAHGLITIKHLIMARDEKTLQQADRIISLLKCSLADEESYVYLLAVNSLAALAIRQTDHVLPILIDSYLNEQRTIQERINVGEVLLQVIKQIGEMAFHYSSQLMDCFFVGLKNKEAIMRTSSLSNIAQLCSLLKYGLQPYIQEIMSGIECLLKTEEDLHVKRAAVMFLHILLSGLDASCVNVIADQLPGIYRLVKNIYSYSLDDIMQLHAQLAFEQLDRIGKELLAPPENEISRKKNLIQVLD